MVRDAILQCADDDDEDDNEDDGEGDEAEDKSEGRKLMIRRATKFYLSDDSTDPGFIPTYRRNMVFIPEARWHLSIVIGVNSLGNSTWHGTILENNTFIMNPEDEAEDEADEGAVPKFNSTEVTTIIAEKIEDFFGPELERVVWTRFLSSPVVTNRLITQPEMVQAAMETRALLEADLQAKRAQCSAAGPPGP